MKTFDKSLPHVGLLDQPASARRRSRRSSRPQCARGIVALAALSMMASCTESPATSLRAPVLAKLVTPDVLPRVQANGQFALRQNGDSASAEINADRAKQLVAAFWHDVGRSLEYGVSRDRGAQVNWTELEPCPRAYYVTSAYRHIQNDAPLIIKKALGPHWLVGLCNAGIQQVVISVSAFATDAKTGRGQFRVEDPGINNFKVMGVPVGAAIPDSPEQIAEFVTNKTGRRLADVPLLVMRPFPKSAMTAVWHVTLDVPVSAIGAVSGSTRHLKSFFAGHLNGWIAPALAADMPTSSANRSDDEVQEFFWARPERHTQYAVARNPRSVRDLELITIGDR
jgi:hypothetical protein